MSEFTREQIIEAAKHCMEDEPCANCPLFGAGSCERVKNEFLLSLAEKEEPAPSETDTSSNNNNSLSHINDTSKSKICQELISQAQTDLLTIYDGMSEGECRAWELGELFKTLEFAKKAGEQGTNV